MGNSLDGLGGLRATRLIVQELLSANASEVLQDIGARLG
jgi:hypothetical protein